MEAKEDALALVAKELHRLGKCSDELCSELVLSQLGVTSMEVLTIVIAMQRKYGIDLDDVIEVGIPVTIGDLVKLIDRRARTP